MKAHRRPAGGLRSKSPPAAALAFVCAAALAGPRASAAPEGELSGIEKDLAFADGELNRIDDQYRQVPDLFSDGDRTDRVTWGEIYYLTKEYQRASMLLFGAVEPRPTDTAPVEARSDYADALYYLADSLYALGNVEAAQGYFEKLLRMRGHDHHEQAILRLMQVGDAQGRFADVDKYYAQYLQVAGTRIPGEVRYLRGKSLFLAKQDEAAAIELGRIPAADSWALRSRYLLGAVYVRQGNLPAAMGMFDQVAFAKAISKDDGRVKEMAHLARGRLFYEMDKLDESINAYQEIAYDSELLTTMLYEVTWTYVRRGQLALRGTKGDNLTDLERRERAKVEYEKALDQLDDLRALEPGGERAAENEILAGNLRLQRNEFESAQAIFGDVLGRYADADAQLSALMADRSTRDRLLNDILQMSTGGLTVDSKLPVLAARRAASNDEVAKALSVFKDIERSKGEIASTTKLLDGLEAQLSPENPSRTELFKPLQSGVERSTSLANLLASLKVRTVAVERGLARPSPELQAQLSAVQTARAALEARVATLPTTEEAVEARKARILERITALDQVLHEAELEVRQRHAELTAVDFMVARDPTGTENPVKMELRRNQVREARQAVEVLEQRATAVREQLDAARRGVALLGGRGSPEELLRTQYAASFDAERALLAQARDAAAAPTYARLDALLGRVDALAQRNTAFRARLDGIVEERLAGTRALIQAERAAVATFASTLAEIDARAVTVRDRATQLALDKVRSELSRIVLRADVGMVDTSFARKQAETEKIGQMRRAKAAELTDLTQAYADLTKDEVP